MRVKARIGKCFTVFVLDGPSFAMLEAGDRKGNMLQLIAVFSAPTKRSMLFKKSNCCFDRALLRGFDPLAEVRVCKGVDN